MIQWRLSEKQQISDQYSVFWIKEERGGREIKEQRLLERRCQIIQNELGTRRGQEIEMGSTETTKAEKDILMDRCKYDPKAMRERTAKLMGDERAQRRDPKI